MRLQQLATTISRRFSNPAKAASGVLIASALACVLFAANAPERDKGVSIHMLPKSVANLAGKKWGLTVDYSGFLKPESAQPVLQSTEELLAFVRKQDRSVQENGVWIVTTNPDAYSEGEKELLQDIVVLCHRERIVLFLSRAADLPNGWKRFD